MHQASHLTFALSHFLGDEKTLAFDRNAGYPRYRRPRPGGSKFLIPCARLNLLDANRVPLNNAQNHRLRPKDRTLGANQQSPL